MHIGLYVKLRLCHSEFNHTLNGCTFSLKSPTRNSMTPFRSSVDVTGKVTDFRQMRQEREEEGQENKRRGIKLNVAEGTGEKERDRWEMNLLVSCRPCACIVQGTVFVDDTRKQLQAKWLYKYCAGVSNIYTRVCMCVCVYVRVNWGKNVYLSMSYGNT